MTKAVLVIDEMPYRCDKCILCDTKDIVMSDDTYGCCVATGNMVKANVLCTGFFEIKKPKWCPLKPMPKVNDLKIDILSHDRFVDGWNKCLDEIIGEKE